MKPNVSDDRYRSFEHAAWERAAANYADSFETVTAPFARPLLDAVDCRPGLRLLDVACGSGFISSLATSLGSTATGVDFSAAMVAQASKRYPSVSFSEADAESLPFADGSFDAIVIGFGIHHFSSPQRAMSEALRVLRGSGRFAFTVWSSSDHALQQLLIDAIGHSGVPGSSLPAPPQGDINNIDTCQRLLLESGFSADHSSFRKLEARVTVSSAASLIEMLAKGTARASALIRLQPDEAMPAVVAALEAAMAQYRSKTSEVFEIPAVAILAVGTRT